MTNSSTAPRCEFARFGRVFILRWNAVPDAESTRAARAALAEAHQAAGEQLLVLLLVIGSAAGMPEGEARHELKAFSAEARQLALASWTVIEAQGAMAMVIRSAIGIMGAATGIDREWMQVGGTAEEALRALCARVDEPADELIAQARQRGLIA